jgi:hypothetical protein
MLEKEVKFISSANSQIKFYNESISSRLFEKIGDLLEALNIKIEERYYCNAKLPPNRIDHYFDDDWTLFSNQCSVSIRSIRAGGSDPIADKLVVKIGDTRAVHNGAVQSLNREVFEAPLEPVVAERLVQDGLTLKDITERLPSITLPMGLQDVLTKKGEAFIRRSFYIVSVDDRPYRISVDRFYFVNSEFDRFSETFTELEFEVRAENNEFTPGAVQLMRVFRALLDVEPSPTSKYKRFHEFSIQEEFDEFYFVGFDIVAYSNDDSWTQKQAVQLFHKTIKDAVASGGFMDSNRPLMISIGDGAILALRSNWHSIIKLIHKIRKAIENVNRSDSIRRIEYRTAVHHGSVFRFTDLNDSINVAGDGVNVVARLLQVAEGGQIVVSDEACSRVLDTGSGDKSQFNDLGRREIKHGRLVHIHEYIGPAKPPQKKRS